MLNEIQKSAAKSLFEKINSPFWGAFVLSWLVWNWQIWYITIFINDNLLFEKEGVLKIELLNHLFSGEFWWAWMMVFPFLSALFLSLIFPRLTNWIYKKDLDFQKEKIRARQKMEKELTENEVKIIEKKEQVLEKKEKIEKTEKEKWNEEYEELKRSHYFQKLNAVIQAMYSRDGKFSYWDDEAGEERIDVNSLEIAYFVSSEIIQKIEKETFDFTEKGKYFVKKFTSENG